jgi:hypothetical protein
MGRRGRDRMVVGFITNINNFSHLKKFLFFKNVGHFE